MGGVQFHEGRVIFCTEKKVVGDHGLNRCGCGKPGIQVQQLMQIGTAGAPVPDNKNRRRFNFNVPGAA
ncbi:MAG: hypothetical protein A2Y87_02200 [Bacteroidetes bacterium RBG_13_46_8]|nr:MAG: hypothetical protein A2Y87_02200 [Bacteroidetes bacterium RBG_13_46_8]